MSHSSRPIFSVAKFTIEGAGEGADHICSAPPRLSSSQNPPASKSVPCFPSINPFSLSRTKSHASFSSDRVMSQGFINSSSASISSAFSPCIHSPRHSSSTCCKFSLPAPASSVSPLHVQSLFPNPFLIKPDLNLQPAPATTATDPPSSSSQTPTHNIPTFSSYGPSTSAFIFQSQTNSTLTSTRKPRKPRPDRVLAPSSFRPRVMAADRLSAWRTPYGLSHDKSLLAELPPALAESAKMSIMGALASSSKSTYGAGLLRFTQFCDKWQISEGARMPASYGLLCAFIGNYKGTTSGKTIKSWLSGIRAWHLTNHATWYGDDKWVQMARISANKEGSRHKRPLRAPVSIEHLLALRRALTLSDPFHAAVWAVALVTFFGCRRLGETTVSSISSFDPSLHVLRSAEYVHHFISFPLFTILFYLQYFFCYPSRWLTFCFIPHPMDENHSRRRCLHHSHCSLGPTLPLHGLARPPYCQPRCSGDLFPICLHHL